MAVAEVLVGRRNGGPAVEASRELALVPFYLSAVEVTNAAGRAVFEFPALDTNLASWVDRIVIRRVDLVVGAGAAFIYVGGEDAVNLRDFTDSLPNVADQTHPVWWPGGKIFRVILSGAGNAINWVVTVQGRQEVD